MNWPQFLIDFYLEFKSFNSQYGSHRYMRVSGSPETYTLNTLYGLAYYATRFDLITPLKAGGSLAASGDDFLSFFKLQQRPEWTHLERHFTLVLVGDDSPYPEFCGWWALPVGAVRSPVLLALKTIYAADHGSLSRKLDSYFLEAFFCEIHGDKVVDYLSADAQEYQAWFMAFCYEHPSMVSHLVFKSFLDPRSVIDRDEFLSALGPAFVHTLPRQLLDVLDFHLRVSSE